MTLARDVLAMWRELWRTNRTVFWVGAIGTLSSVIASIILNVTIADPHMWSVLIFFSIGSISLTYNAYMMKDSWMMVLMAWYTIINTMGMISLILNT